MYYDVKIQSGECIVDGIEINKLKKREIPYLRRKIGIIFQDFKLLSDRSIFKNLEFVLKATDWTNKTKINNRIDEVLEQVKMTDFKNRLPYQLSGGEQQRISIARAILNNPNLILADEPTGNLDTETSESIIRLLRTLCKVGNTTFLIVTHDHSIAEQCDRVLQMADGKFLHASEEE